MQRVTLLLLAAAQAPEDRAANDALGAALSPRWTLLRDPMELRRAVETYDGSLLQAGLSLIGQAATETVDGRGELVHAPLDVTGAVNLPDGTEMCMPGDNTDMTVELGAPIAMDEGLRFAIREGGRTVGAGRVVKILK